MLLGVVVVAESAIRVGFRVGALFGGTGGVRRGGWFVAEEKCSVVGGNPRRKQGGGSYPFLPVVYLVCVPCRLSG